MRTLLVVFAAIALSLIVGNGFAQDQRSVADSESGHFALTVAPGDVFQPVPELRARFDEVFEYVSERIGIPGDVLKTGNIASPFESLGLPASVIARLTPQGGKVQVSFVEPQPSACPIRGLAAPGGARNSITIYANESTPVDQVLAVLAHELGHLFQWVGLGRGGPAGFFDQGFASWAAGKYWTDWYGTTSLSEAMSALIKIDSFIPLAETYQLAETMFPRSDGSSSPNCLERRNIIYTEWAAFVEFLAETYGHEKLYDLVSSTADISDQVYLSVYGSTFEQLDAEWIRSLQ